MSPVEKSILIWKWMLENDLYVKEVAYKELGLQSDLNDCPLCEIYFDEDCRCCPLNLPDVGACPSFGHPYYEWSELLLVLPSLRDRPRLRECTQIMLTTLEGLKEK